VIIGDVGYRDRIVFTALGDPVNVAARLQGQEMGEPIPALRMAKGCSTVCWQSLIASG
jgi:class 3 adenylate cyclase